jgi:hypothetical protein
MRSSTAKIIHSDIVNQNYFGVLDFAEIRMGRSWDLNPGKRLHRPLGYQATSPRPRFWNVVCKVCYEVDASLFEKFFVCIW